MRRKRSFLRTHAFFFFWMTGAAALCGPLPSAVAATINLNPANFSNPGALIDPNIVTPIVKTIGFASDHRAYEGATGLGNSAGIDLSVQATAVKLPSNFRDALTAAGLSQLPLPIVPVPRLMAHKGIGDRFDIGASWIWYRELQITGFDAKWVTYQPEEGPTWAVRLNYTFCKLDFTGGGATLGVHTQTFKPEILVSQKLDFAEPYLGIGYQIVNGKLILDLPFPAPLPTISQTIDAHGGGGLAFIGLALKAPGLALRLIVDGEYSTVGAHALGAKFGLSF
jgi:hypothetical protein